MTDKLRAAAEQALEAFALAQTDIEWQLNSPTRKVLRKAELALRAALSEPLTPVSLDAGKSTGPVVSGSTPVDWADKAMELATDFGVESLIVGSHERKDSLLNNGVYSFETTLLRDKREAARDRLRQYLYAHPPQQVTAEPVAWMYEWDGKQHLTLTDQRFVEKAHPNFNKSVPLYASPPPPQEFVCSTGLCHYRKPLSEAEIHNLDPLPHDTFDTQRVEFARLVEKAHGILESSKV